MELSLSYWQEMFLITSEARLFPHLNAWFVLHFYTMIDKPKGGMFCLLWKTVVDFLFIQNIKLVSKSKNKTILALPFSIVEKAKSINTIRL